MDQQEWSVILPMRNVAAWAVKESATRLAPHLKTLSNKPEAAMKCARCSVELEKSSESQSWLMLLNPAVWLFDSPLNVGRYCKDCAGLIALLGIMIWLVALIAGFITIVISISSS